MRNAIIRQRARVARAWAGTDRARTPRQAKRRAAIYLEERRQLAHLRLTLWQVVEYARDRGRCPECHKTISLAAAEHYR